MIWKLRLKFNINKKHLVSERFSTLQVEYLIIFIKN